jgi:hypothetical protein
VRKHDKTLPHSLHHNEGIIIRSLFIILFEHVKKFFQCLHDLDVNVFFYWLEVGIVKTFFPWTRRRVAHHYIKKEKNRGRALEITNSSLKGYHPWNLRHNHTWPTTTLNYPTPAIAWSEERPLALAMVHSRASSLAKGSSHTRRRAIKHTHIPMLPNRPSTQNH